MSDWKPIEDIDFENPIWVLKYDMYYTKEGNSTDKHTPNATKYTDCHGWYDNERDALLVRNHFGPDSYYYIEKVYRRKLKENAMVNDELINFVNECEALTLWNKGIKPGFSSDVADNLTCGYGKLDDYGNWQFPLYPAEDYLSRTKIKLPSEVK